MILKNPQYAAQYCCTRKITSKDKTLQQTHTQQKEEIRVAVEYFILTYVTGASAAAADDASPPHIHTLAYFSLLFYYHISSSWFLVLVCIECVWPKRKWCACARLWLEGLKILKKIRWNFVASKNEVTSGGFWALRVIMTGKTRTKQEPRTPGGLGRMKWLH